MKTVVSVLLLLCSLVVSAAAQGNDVHRFRLENGLDVVLLPDHRTTKVVFSLRYRTGVINEPPGRSGFAHLFEHLMFSGTAAHPNIDNAYSALGIDLNAWSYDDFTLYYAAGLSAHLPFILSLEADRMANQGRSITGDDLAIQRDVVFNEMRVNYLDAAGVAGEEALRAAIFPDGHPYSRPGIGSIPDLQAATIEDVHGFFSAYYMPNNAILVLAGDLDPAAARVMVEETFGKVPRGPEVSRPAPADPVPTRVRLDLEDRVPTTSLLLAWSVPGYRSPDRGALRLAAQMLTDPDYGVLRRALVETGLATDASAWLEETWLASRFQVTVIASEGIGAEAIEAAARAAVEGFLAGPVDAGDLERARKRLLLDDRLSNEQLDVRAERAGLAADYLDAPEAALSDDRDLVRPDAVAVADTARRWLSPDDASVAIIQPGERGGYPEALMRSSGDPAPLAAVERPEVGIPLLPPGEPRLGALPERQTAALRNGIGVIHYEAAGSPLTYVAVASRVGRTSAPEGLEGIVDLATEMATRGFGGRTLADLTRAAQDIGATIGWQTDERGTFLSVSTPPDSVPDALSLLAGSVRTPDFPQSEWAVAHAATLDDLAWRESDIADVARRAANAALFPKRAGLPAIDMSFASIRRIDRSAARQAFGHIFTPEAVTLISVGPGPLADVLPSLESAFGDWRSGTPAWPERSHPPATFPESRTVLFLDEPGASQTAIRLSRPAPGLDDAGVAEAATVARLLGNDFNSRLNTVIREEKGYTYGTAANIGAIARSGSALYTEMTVEAEHTGEALADIFAGFGSLVTAPPGQDEVMRTVTAYQTAIAGMAETGGGLFGMILAQTGNAASLEAEYQRHLEVIDVSLAAVQREAAGLAGLENAVVVLVGDPDIVLPQLTAMGLDVTILPREVP